MAAEKPITDQALREKFESYKDIFRGSNSAEQFGAAADMLVTISAYLGENVQSIDVWPITRILAEYAKIEMGGEPDFIKNHGSKRGRSYDPMHNLNQASLAAAMQILVKHDYKVHEAIELVANHSWMDKKQLKQLRKDYGRKKKWTVATEWSFEQSQLKFPSQKEALNHVKSLLAIANQSKGSK